MIELRFDCLAFCETEEAARIYERRRPGLGVRSNQEVCQTVERIAANPLLYSRIHGDLRKCRVRKSPYGVIYRYADNIIEILVVMHLHRDPDYWKRRLLDL